MVLDSIAGQDKKSMPPATPFANSQLQDAELLSVEGHNLGDRLPGPLPQPQELQSDCNLIFPSHLQYDI